MTQNMQLWSVTGNDIVHIQKKNLDLERSLENWIEKDPSLLGLDLCIIGRQVRTEYGGIIDLLGMDEEGKLVVIELKRDRTPRDIVAQVLDYASWIKTLSFDKIDSICKEYSKMGIQETFRKYYNIEMPDEINSDHSLLIVATEVDSATERIIQYLQNQHQVSINAIFFNLFSVNGSDVIGRSWLSDPVVVDAKTTSKGVPWDGWYYVNTGISDDRQHQRSWDLNLKYHFVSAGGGPRWIAAIKKLKPGNRFFAYIRGHGYVGFGEVIAEAVPVKDFRVDGSPLCGLLPPGEYELMHDAENPEICEWLVSVRWITTFPQFEARTFKSIFASTHVVCKLREPESVKFLLKEFKVKD